MAESNILQDRKTGYYYASGNPMSISWQKANKEAMALNKWLEDHKEQLKA